jgi:NADH-quinone oxidoreductase subunit N
MSDYLLPVLPIAALVCGLTIAMITIAVRRSHRATCCIALGAIAAAGGCLARLALSAPVQGGLLFVADGFAVFYAALVLGAGAAVAILAYGYLEGRSVRPEEFYLLLLGALAGALALVGACHFASFFLGLETLSVSLYGLIAYPRSDVRQTEGAIKYLVLSGASSALLLYGMALVYGVTGTMAFPALFQALGHAAGGQAAAGAGMALIVIGVGFKLGVVPFHMWTPDVYEGAPAPVTAFIATASKGAVFALVMRYFSGSALSGLPHIFAAFGVVAVASMLIGNLLALFQKNVKRLLAYSSIAHFGYLLVAFMSPGPYRTAAVTFYLVAYFVTVLGAFSVMTVLSGKERDADRMEDYQGLFYRRPYLAGAFVLQLLSLAGMPLTAGFIGKVYVVAAGVDAALRLPVAALIAGSGISLFYYLRVIAALFRRPADAPAAQPPAVPPGPLGARIMTAALFVLLVWWGIYPGPILAVIALIKPGSP